MLSVNFFFFKQKTAYEMRISDWSSDVCSSDLNKNREKLISEAKASNGGEKPIRERMAVITIHPKPFFADKNRAFWNLQSLGWFGALIMRGSSGLANGQPISFLVPVLISTVPGYSLTLLMAVIFRALLRQRPFIPWGVSILVVLWCMGERG